MSEKNATSRKINNKPHIPQYLSLKLYSTVRSKNLVQTLFQYGVGISYSRILQMIDDLSITVTSFYKMSENKVKPSNARKGILPYCR